ncbi:MAG: transcriptional regulator NrdR [Bacillota bacterium]|jgi:transcriptional repressor NrdR
MRCPFCDFEDSKVLDSRPSDEGRSIRRRRECLGCQKRFTTYEKIEALPLIVVKKDGRREVFDSRKLLNGLMKACEKRPISYEKLEEIGESIERELSNSLDREIDTRLIGEAVMGKLKELDQVAYVRFASVYRQFTDVNTFIQEIELLQKNDNK